MIQVYPQGGLLIKVNLIPGLPTTTFRNGKGAYKGVVCHYTYSGSGDGSDTPTSERNYESRTYNNAFVDYFVGVGNNQPENTTSSTY